MSSDFAAGGQRTLSVVAAVSMLAYSVLPYAA